MSVHGNGLYRSITISVLTHSLTHSWLESREIWLPAWLQGNRRRERGSKSLERSLFSRQFPSLFKILWKFTRWKWRFYMWPGSNNCWLHCGSAVSAVHPGIYRSRAKGFIGKNQSKGGGVRCPLPRHPCGAGMVQQKVNDFWWTARLFTSSLTDATLDPAVFVGDDLSCKINWIDN